MEFNLFTAEGFKQGVVKLGFFAPIIYIWIIALSVVISPVPGSTLAMVAGNMWGGTLAGIYTIIGGFLGSLIAYFLGKTLGHTAIKKITGKTIYFTKTKGEFYLTCLVFITRLLPIFSFDLISYGAGIAGLSLPKYAIATLLGMIPSTFLLTHLGSSISTFSSGINYGIITLIILVILPFVIHKFNLFNLKNIVIIK
ncbi:VTT domain-containing protein [Cyanobacterium aponinum UTEX 3221]|nr:VTT domain-containing protein [Cyanobacterium aponinum]WRL37589.1 VTT domain-containing protein [Cyanobacterium aponinum UTEX 3221]